jgi:hypothetical protein
MASSSDSNGVHVASNRQLSPASLPNVGGGRNKKGGAAQSGWNYVLNQVGLGHNQMHNSAVSSEWNAIRSTSGGPYSVATNPANAKYYKGGKKRSGGSFGSVLATAVTPAALWAAQNNFGSSRQSYKKRRGGSVAGVIGTAIAPAALWAAQNKLTRRRTSAKFRGTRRFKGSRRRRY